jgi:hypothetical protein
MVVRDARPTCGANRYKKNGHPRHGKQQHRCQACERQGVATAADRLIMDEQRTTVAYLLREHISHQGNGNLVQRSHVLPNVETML